MRCALVLLFWICACQLAQTEDLSTHIGLDLDGTLSRVVIDNDASTWSVEGDGESIGGAWSVETEPEYEGFYALEGGGVGAWMPGRLALLSHDGDLVVAVERGKDVEQLAPLMQGHYTWIRLRRDSTALADWGFLTLRGDEFFYSSRSSDEVGMEEILYGTHQLDADNSEMQGTFTLGGEDPQAIVLEAADGRWGGVVDPGWGMVLQAPEGDGILVAIWSPQAHEQLTEWDGLHQGIQFQSDDGDFVAQRGAAFDIFGLEGLVWERSADGVSKDHHLSSRIPIFMVGNMAFWTDEDAGLRYYLVQWGGWMSWFTQPQGTGGPGGESGGGMLAWGVGVHP